MQSICSLAALVLAVAGPGECGTANGAGISKTAGAHTQAVAASSGPSRTQTAFKYYMPRPVSPPRIPRPRWP